jgi:hypothetical protein
MDNRTLGFLLTGFAVRAAAAAAAIYVAVTVGQYVYHVFTAVDTALNVVR